MASRCIECNVLDLLLYLLIHVLISIEKILLIILSGNAYQT